ncbi:MAG: hypothetical protein HQM08_11315 [Candidatus Riflebacteria bacterium]|nr:hypothetical protein [Candidatus Riflebacteria bacterium]
MTKLFFKKFIKLFPLLTVFALSLNNCAGQDCIPGSNTYAFSLKNVNPEYTITFQQCQDWNKVKASFGPTYAGSPGWTNYMGYIEPLFKAAGIIDVEHIDMPYDFYSVDDFPIASPGVEELVSDGEAVQVAGYGMTSGSTPAEGISAPMIYYDDESPPNDAEIQGKILVFLMEKIPSPPFSNAYMESFVISDFLWRNESPPFWPLWQNVPPCITTSYYYRWNWIQISKYAAIGIRAKAAGMVVVYDISPGGAKGLTQRSVYTSDKQPKSAYVNCPTLTLDRVAGIKVIADAKAGRTANLKLRGKFVPSVGKGFYGFLPGKNYGSENDEWVVLCSHTDGMSLVEENGALGILGIINYFKNIPQSERPRTLMVYLDCRHFMPGGESKWPEFSYFGPLHHSDHVKKVLATVGIEHLGALETIETGAGGNDYRLSGRVEASFIGLYNNNPWLLKIASKAVIDNNWPRVTIRSNGANEPGVNGGYMSKVRTPMMIGNTLEPKKPGIGLAGNWPGSQTQTIAQLGVFDPNLFHSQVKGMTQIIGELMLVRPIIIDLGWGKMHAMINNLTETSFIDPKKTATQKTVLLSLYSQLFENIENVNLSLGKNLLQTIKTNVATQLTPTIATPLLELINQQISKI